MTPSVSASGHSGARVPLLANALSLELGRLATAPGTAEAVPTGFGDLDAITGGMRPGQLWTICGRSGVGKTVLALDLARSATVRHSIPTLVLPRVQSPGEIALKVLCAHGRLPLQAAANGRLSATELARAHEHLAALENAPLRLARPSAPNVPRPAPWNDGTSADDPPRIVVADDIPAGPDQQRHLLELAAFAAERRCTFIAVTQADLANPRQQLLVLEQHADVSLLLVRHDQEKPTRSPTGAATLRVTRNRAGPVGTTALDFLGYCATFRDTNQQQPR